MDDEVPITLIHVAPPPIPSTFSGPPYVQVYPYWMTSYQAEAPITRGQLVYDEEYGSPSTSLNSPIDFSPEYSPSAFSFSPNLSLSPLTGALEECSVDDTDYSYSPTHSLANSEELFAAAWQPEFLYISPESPQEVNARGLLLGSGSGHSVPSPLSGFPQDLFEGLQPRLQFDDKECATDDPVDHMHARNMTIWAPIPRWPLAESSLPLAEHFLGNSRHSHSDGGDSPNVDSIQQHRRIHSESAPEIWPHSCYRDTSIVSGSTAIPSDSDLDPHCESSPSPSLNPFPITTEGDELSSMDNIPRATIASDAVLRAAAKRRRKKAAFECTLCGNFLTSKDNLNNHIAAHNGLKRFSCNVCHKSFGTRSVMRRHQRSVKCLSSRSSKKLYWPLSRPLKN